MTPDQRDTLISIYQTLGPEAARAKALEFGASPRYVAQLLRRRGIKNTSKRGAKPGAVRKSDREDSRWQWAIERGEVRI